MKKVVLIIASVFLLLAVPVTVFFIGQNQEMRKKAAPATTLSLSPQTTTAKAGDMITMNVEIDTGGNQVGTAKISLLFDQTKLEAQSITSGPQAPRILSQGVTGPGTASITIGAQNSSKPITGKGVVAVVRFIVLSGASGGVSVQLGNDTFVGGFGESTANVLVGKTAAQITISVGNITSFGGGTTTTPPAIAPNPITTITPTTPIPTGAPITTPAPTIKASIPESYSMVPDTTGKLTVSAYQDASKSAVIKGKAPPNSTVTIIIHSTPKTVTVTTDANGNYVYADASLESGEHSVVVSTTDAAGQALTTSSTFTVGDTTMEGMPISGSTGQTIILLAISAFFIVISISMISYKRI